MNFNEPPHPVYYELSTNSTTKLAAPSLEPPQKAHSGSVDAVIVGGGVIFFFFYTYWLFKSLMERAELSPLFLCLPFVCIFLWEWNNRRQRQYRSTFIAKYQFPALIQEKIRKHYPHLSDEDLWLVKQGLRQYLQLCNTGKVMAMPSRVVDVAWHEFILMTRSYDGFCRRGLGRFLHHMPVSDEHTSDMVSDGMKHIWQQACEWEQINPQYPARLPFLFMIDGALQIPDGLMHNLHNHYMVKEKPSERRRVCEECAGHFICENCESPADE